MVIFRSDIVVFIYIIILFLVIIVQDVKRSDKQDNEFELNGGEGKLDNCK